MLDKEKSLGIINNRNSLMPLLFGSIMVINLIMENLYMLKLYLSSMVA